MDILIALAFVGGFTGLITAGMLVTMYFYSHDALGLCRSRGVRSLSTLTARSVPVQVSTGAGQSEINLGLSTDPSARYIRRSMMVMACFILLIIIVLVSVLNASFL
jgi:heme A synthase